MPLITVGTLATRLIQEFGEANDTEYNQIVLNWINDAIDEVSILTDWKFFHSTYTFNTVAGTRVYNMPSDLRDIRSIYIPLPLVQIGYTTVSDLESRGFDLNEPGQPTRFYDEKSTVVGSDLIKQIALWPVPAQVYSIQVDYIYHPSDLLTAENIPVPQEMYRAIKYRVLADQLSFEKDYDGADRAYQRFGAMLMQLSRKNKNTTAQNLILGVTDVPTDILRDLRLDPSRYSN